MPNAKCEKCKLYLDDICKKQKHVDKLIDLFKNNSLNNELRSKRWKTQMLK